MTHPMGTGADRVEHLSQDLLRLSADFGKLEARLMQLEQARSAQPDGQAARENLTAAVGQPWRSLAQALQERVENAVAAYFEERYRLTVEPKLRQVSAEKAVLAEAYEPVKRILERANSLRTHHGHVMSAITAQAGTLRMFIEESDRTCTGLKSDAASPVLPALPAIPVPEWSAVSVWHPEENRVRLAAQVDGWEQIVNAAVAECFALAEQRSNALAVKLDQYVETGVPDRLENQAINLHTMIYFEWKQDSVAELQEPLRTLEGWGRELVTRLGIEVLPCQEGAAFSSYHHVSIGEEEASGRPPNTVLKEVAPGYRKGKQSLQLAKVIVSKR